MIISLVIIAKSVHYFVYISLFHIFSITFNYCFITKVIIKNYGW